jgi:hypothetical protein
MQSKPRAKVIAVAFDGTPVETLAPATRSRRTWFGRLILALKMSRQNQARRELARFAHLIDPHIDLERRLAATRDDD